MTHVLTLFGLTIPLGTTKLHKGISIIVRDERIHCDKRKKRNINHGNRSACNSNCWHSNYTMCLLGVTDKNDSEWNFTDVHILRVLYAASLVAVPIHITSCIKSVRIVCGNYPHN